MARSTRTEGSGVRAVETALAVLERVAFSEEPLGVTQIASAVGLTKSAIFRHLQTLVDRGFLVQDSSTRYRLGPKAYLIGRLAPATTDIAGIAHPHMREARDASGQAVVISTLTPRGVFVLDTLPGRMAIEIGVRPGGELAFHASAQGKIFLAFGPPELLPKVMAGDLPRLTSQTIVDPAVLEREIERVRERGYAVAPQESLLGVNTLAAPVFNHEGRLAAAVALVGSIQHVTPEPDETQIALIRELSQTISRALGNGLITVPGLPRGDVAPARSRAAGLRSTRTEA